MVTYQHDAETLILLILLGFIHQDVAIFNAHVACLVGLVDTGVGWVNFHLVGSVGCRGFQKGIRVGC